MKELKLGKISNAELADWFETSEKNLSNRKKMFLEKLQEYCDFKPYRGGVEVFKINKFFYCKNKNYQIVYDNFDSAWDPSGLDTCSRVGSQIYQEHKDELTVQESTTIKHTLQVRNTKYSKPFSEEPGPEGRCWYVLSKKINGRAVALSDEEELKKKQLLSKWFGSAEEKTVIVNMMIENGEISEQEAWSYYKSVMRLPKSYSGFMFEFKKETGIQLVKGTNIEKNACAFELKEEEFDM